MLAIGMAGCLSSQSQGLFGSRPAPVSPEKITAVIVGLYLPQQIPLGPFGGRLSDLPNTADSAKWHLVRIVREGQAGPGQVPVHFWAEVGFWWDKKAGLLKVDVVVHEEDQVWTGHKEIDTASGGRELLALINPPVIELPTAESPRYIFVVGLLERD